jgi:ABC-type nitrate/sulfonate/bicarbonate transport system substrate-binding protein
MKRQIYREWNEQTEIHVPRLQPARLPAKNRFSKTLRIGFLPVADCAPIAVASEFGLFKRHGLSVQLKRATTWKNLHDQIAYREIDAAHAPAMLPFLMRMGVTSNQVSCVTGMILSLQGNAITISNNLWRSGVRDAGELGKRIAQENENRVYAFAVDLPFSTEYFQLCEWLRKGGLTPLRKVRIVKAPLEEMVPMLKLGCIDGFCAGEPWTTVALRTGIGRCVCTSAVAAPLHPEKLLLVREDFAEKSPQEHERMIAALIDACAFCDAEENRQALSDILAQPQYVNAPAECLLSSLAIPTEAANAGAPSLGGLNIFQRHRANEPTAARASWISGQLHRVFRWKARPQGLEKIFRPDIYHRAKGLARAAKIAPTRPTPVAILCN